MCLPDYLTLSRSINKESILLSGPCRPSRTRINRQPRPRTWIPSPTPLVNADGAACRAAGRDVPDGAPGAAWTRALCATGWVIHAPGPGPEHSEGSNQIWATRPRAHRNRCAQIDHQTAGLRAPAPGRERPNSCSYPRQLATACQSVTATGMTSGEKTISKIAMTWGYKCRSMDVPVLVVPDAAPACRWLPLAPLPLVDLLRSPASRSDRSATTGHSTAYKVD